MGRAKTMSHFDQSWNTLKDIEGGYVDHKDDRGGATKYGITEETARAHGYKGKMQDLTEPVAREIAKSAYWDIINLDEVAKVSPRIAFEMFDTGYNMHPVHAGKFLQRTLNALNRQEKDYPECYVDGIVGKSTLYSLRRFIEIRKAEGESVLLTALNSLQVSRYIELSERRKQNESFTFGWILHRAVKQLRDFLKEIA